MNHRNPQKSKYSWILILCIIVGLISLRKEIKTPIKWKSVFFKPIFCSLLCGVAAYTSHGLLSAFIPFKIATVFSILIAGLVYVLSLFLTKTINYEELNSIPKCKKIVKILEKHKLIG